jgi:hypothetical protein
VILRDFETQSFGVGGLSSGTAAAVGAFGVASSFEYPLYALLGVLAAFWGVAFIRAVAAGGAVLGARATGTCVVNEALFPPAVPAP